MRGSGSAVLVLTWFFSLSQVGPAGAAVRQVRVRLHPPAGKLSRGAPDGAYQENGFHPQRGETFLNLPDRKSVV